MISLLIIGVLAVTVVVLLINRRYWKCNSEYFFKMQDGLRDRLMHAYAERDKASARCAELERELKQTVVDLVEINKRDTQIEKLTADLDIAQKEALLQAENAEKWRRERDFYLSLSQNYLADVRVEARKRERLWLFARTLVRQKDEMQRVIIGLQGEVAASGEVSEILLEGEAEKQADLLEKIDTARRASEKYRSRLRRLEAGIRKIIKRMEEYQLPNNVLEALLRKERKP